MIIEKNRIESKLNFGTELDLELSQAKVADAFGLKGVTVKTMEETTSELKQSFKDQKKVITLFIEVILTKSLESL